MTSSRPFFVDSQDDTGRTATVQREQTPDDQTAHTEQSVAGFDTEQLIEEAVPLAKLVGAVGVLAYVPLLPQLVLDGLFRVEIPFMTYVPLVSQFILAVGTGLVLLYILVRAEQMSEQS